MGAVGIGAESSRISLSLMTLRPVLAQISSCRCSWRSMPSPQHKVVSLADIAQECWYPQTTAMASSTPSTWTGTGLFAAWFVPLPGLPSCPRSPQPQHFTKPVYSTAQLCNAPEQMAMAFSLVPLPWKCPGIMPHGKKHGLPLHCLVLLVQWNPYTKKGQATENNRFVIIFPVEIRI